MLINVSVDLVLLALWNGDIGGGSHCGALWCMNEYLTLNDIPFQLMLLLTVGKVLPNKYLF